MDALLADRAQEKAGEIAVTARANDKEIARRGRGDECFRCGTLDNLTVDLDALNVLTDIGERALE